MRQTHLAFPSTMVDRIVPAMTDEAFATLEARLGSRDPVAVEAEPFCQWVIEDNFRQGPPGVGKGRRRTGARRAAV